MKRFPLGTTTIAGLAIATATATFGCAAESGSQAQGSVADTQCGGSKPPPSGGSTPDAGGTAPTPTPGGGTAADAGPAPTTPAPPIPELALWESNMKSFGKTHCETTGATLDERLGATYYDRIRVMYQIADYTGDAYWNGCAIKARNAYRDEYVIPNNAGVPGYWNFTTGLRMDFERTGDPLSKQAAISLSTNAAFAADTAPLEWTAPSTLNREVAYAILAYINAESLGAPPRARRKDLVNQAYDHLDQWFVRFTWDPNASEGIQPFMVGLTAYALIKDWEQTKDARLIPSLERAADWLWNNAWMPANEAFWYEVSRKEPAADLNNLIAPLYGFLYRQTGNTTQMDRGDALFAGSAKFSYVTGEKQFNQTYIFSFDYVKWRSGK